MTDSIKHVEYEALNLIKLEEEVIKLQLAMEILEIIHYSKKYKLLNGNLMFTCSYTAPGLAVIIVFLDKNNIRNIDEFERFIVENGGEDVVVGKLNNAIGMFIDLHFIVHNLPAGIPFFIKNNDRRIQTQLGAGVNLVSFSIENATTVHHALIYTLSSNKCLIADSWCSGKGSTRPIYIRGAGDLLGPGDSGFLEISGFARQSRILLSTSDVQRDLDEINSGTIEQDNLTNIMQRLFLSPPNVVFTSLRVTIFHSDTIESEMIVAFNEFDLIGHKYGGIKRTKSMSKNKRNRKKYKKRKTQKRIIK